MFEYLMPLLVMRNYADTLLDQTYQTVVDRQIEYGRERGVPWGISESAYNVRDLQLNYQYGPFGVPGLGLKRGLDRRPRGRSIRNRARSDDHSSGRDGEPATTCKEKARLRDMVFTSRSITRRAPAQESKARPDSRVHDPPPGNESGRAGQRSA